MTPTINSETSNNLLCSLADFIIATTIEGLNNPKRKCNRGNMINYCERILYDKYNSFYKLYTDGSKDVSGSGAAVFDPQAGISLKFKIDSDTNIMHTEPIAISECLSYILSLECDKFVILSDSKSALLH
ncbi:unnamed protein product [Leptidea sinapis]|uniref:RNase H type-1 domain-containing protein n=1 Tax=Leptidea sinapis TaxID=189913 RepID=A0A5E4PQV8_9NEOP|nr:unnamed protein product [Leptidea sinapis]